MPLDPLVADLLACLEDTHAATGFTRDPLVFCQLQGIEYLIGPSNMARVSPWRDGPDIIFVRREQYGSRDLFSVWHEAAHVVAKREGYIKLIRKHHKVHPAYMRRHIELLMNEGGARMLMPTQDLESAAWTYGDTPRAIRLLSDLSGASQPAAMRRWTRQDFSEPRAAFEIFEGYVHDVTTWGARVPFRKWDRVHEVALEHPDLMLLGIGKGHVLGTITG